MLSYAVQNVYKKISGHFWSMLLFAGELSAVTVMAMWWFQDDAIDADEKDDNEDKDYIDGDDDDDDDDKGEKYGNAEKMTIMPGQLSLLCGLSWVVMRLSPVTTVTTMWWKRW